jgi:NIMA (never in mitosis gene a)-related kinase
MAEIPQREWTSESYVIQKVIGEGSYGRALLCKDKLDDQLIVVKEVSFASLTPQEIEEARKETMILAKLNHPNIVQYLGSFLERNIFHIVMEFADGGDLGGKIDEAASTKTPFTEDRILDWFVQICFAMKHVHDRKILHRDLKTQNIFLMRNGRVKLGDFGIAKVLDSTMAMAKTAIGTPYYLSPEICQGKPYNAKSDVWSLGCVLYELCALTHPFDATTINGLVMKIVRSKQAPVPKEFSNKLRGLIDNLLQKDPKKRPAVKQVFELDFIKERIDNLLSATRKKIEFSHTVFHGLPALAQPDDLPAIAEVKPAAGRASARASTPSKAPSRGKAAVGSKGSTGKVAAAPAAKPPPAKPAAAPAKPAATPAKKAAGRPVTPKEPARAAAAPPPAKRETVAQAKLRLQQQQKDSTTRPGQVQKRTDGADVVALVNAKKSGDDVVQIGQVMVDLGDGKGVSTDEALQSLGLGLDFDDDGGGDVSELQAFAAVASQHLENGGGDDDDDEGGTEKFFFRGQEVPLKATDPAARLAEIRAFIEKGLGAKDKFTKAYQLVANEPEGLDEAQLNARFKTFLKTDAEMEFLDLIRQYVVIEIALKGE